MSRNLLCLSLLAVLLGACQANPGAEAGKAATTDVVDALAPDAAKGQIEERLKLYAAQQPYREKM